VVATGVVTTLAGMAGMPPGSADGTGSAARFNYPDALACDGDNLYVVDARNNTIRRLVISSRVVTTIAGTAGMRDVTDGVGAAARFYNLIAAVADGAGNVYVTDGSVIRQIVLSTANVTTLVGVQGRWGVVLGDLSVANLNSPGGMAMLPNGAIAITDYIENAVLMLK
jgi:DNA-binding beta-propeller fold protein YncE